MLAAVRPSTLLWQLFAANAAVMALATTILVVAPVRVSEDPVLAEAAVLAGGLTLLLVVHLAALRRTLAPLRRVTAVMGAVDALSPGRRVGEDRRAPEEVAALARAFDAMLDRLEDARRSSARRSLAAQEDERRRIAREIHDELGQTLTAIALQAERAAQDGGAGAGTLDAIARAAHHGLEDVRRIGRELRPEALDDLGLGNALISLCRRMSAQSGVPVHAHLSPGLPALAREVELVLYRVAQEAITNALRHAAPGEVDVSLDCDGRTVRLEVLDDGRGLPARLPGDSAGLTGMQERALLVDGRIDLGRRAPRGTRVALEIPMEEAAA